MISFSKKYGGGNTGDVAHLLYIFSSRDYLVPEDGELEILAGAAAGSGAALHNAGTSAGGATGGGAGEMGRVVLPVVKGQVITVTVPSGGVGVQASRDNPISQGNPGGDLVITTDGWTGRLNGGKGGKAAAANGVLDGGEGGQGGSGFDVLMPGSRGGRIAIATAGLSITGGGAANPVGHPANTGRGGDVIGAGPRASTGGGGVGGNGGDKLNASSYVDTTGGGYGSSADPDSNLAASVGRNAAGIAGGPSPAFLVPMLASFGLDYFGGGGHVSIASGPGGGSGSDNMNVASAPLNPGIFGGSGAFSVSDSGSRTGAPGGLCAGSGAGRTLGGTTSVTTGKGGNGFAVFLLRRV